MNTLRENHFRITYDNNISDLDFDEISYEIDKIFQDYEGLNVLEGFVKLLEKCECISSYDDDRIIFHYHFLSLKE